MTVVDAAEQAREQLNTGTTDVEQSQRFDETALDRWMLAHVAGYAGPLSVRHFRGGQSNPTYQLITPARTYVLRRKPSGKLLPSALGRVRDGTAKRADAGDLAGRVQELAEASWNYALRAGAAT